MTIHSQILENPNVLFCKLLDKFDLIFIEKGIFK